MKIVIEQIDNGFLLRSETKSLYYANSELALKDALVSGKFESGDVIVFKVRHAEKVGAVLVMEWSLQMDIRGLES